MSVILDITELLRNPMRTGIQRVVRELIRHWPDDDFVLASFDEGLRSVSRGVLPLLLETDPRTRSANVAEVAAMLAAVSGPARRLPPAPILVPEVCYNPRRWAWYRALAAREANAFSVLVHDFIPWLHADLYSVPRDPIVAPYFEFVATARRVAYTSAAVRDEAVRSGCAQAGPVFAPGADGLGLERQSFDPARNTWVVVGSVCRNKGHDLVLAAFEQLWAQGFGGELIFVGRLAEEAFAPMIAAAERKSRFRHVADAPDETVRKILRRARATIAVSHVEGYGLAPLESLAAGIPTITTASLPSLGAIADRGQIRLAVPTAAGVAGAVRKLGDDGHARRLWAEAQNLELPSWKNFAAGLAGWAKTGRRDVGFLSRLLRG